MILVADVKSENEKCRSCSSDVDLIEIQIVDTTVNISDRVIICEMCKRKLVDRLLPF